MDRRQPNALARPLNKKADTLLVLWVHSASFAQAFVGPVWGNI